MFSTVLQFYLLLKVLIFIHIDIHVFIGQRGCCRRITFFQHSRSGSGNNEFQIHRSVYRQRDLLHSLIYIRMSPQRDILGIAIGCVQGTFHQLGLTILFLIERITLELVLTEDESAGARHDEIALSIHYRRPYQLLALQGSLYQRYSAAKRIRNSIDRNRGVDNERIMIRTGFIIRLCNQRYVIVTGPFVYDIEIAGRTTARKRTLAGGNVQQRSGISGRQYFLRQHITLCIQQLAGTHFREGKTQYFLCILQRAESIYRHHRREHEFLLRFAIMHRLGTDDDITVTRAVGTDMQSRRTLFPTPVVLFDFIGT